MNKPPILCDRCDRNFSCLLDYDEKACRKARSVEPTNADRIRSMTDEEMARWVRRYGDCLLTHCCAFDICVPTMEDMSCEDWILKWLKMEGE